jgi:hypothetical protein
MSIGGTIMPASVKAMSGRLQSTDNLNTTQTLEYTKDKYNVKIIK